MFFLPDSDGCVRGSSHLLNITLTMHRLLLSSTDLLDKLVSLYPLTTADARPGFKQCTECNIDRSRYLLSSSVPVGCFFFYPSLYLVFFKVFPSRLFLPLHS